MLEDQLLLFGCTLILFHALAKLQLTGCCPFDLEMCCSWSWNQLISKVLPVRDKSDEEEPEPAGWKTSEPREFVGVGAVFCGCL